MEQIGELVVTVRTSGIDSNAGIDVHASREDRRFEAESKFVDLILVCLPNVTAEKLAEHGVLLALREDWEAGQLVGSLEVGAAHNVGSGFLRDRLGGLDLLLVGFHSFGRSRLSRGLDDRFLLTEGLLLSI